MNPVIAGRLLTDASLTDAALAITADLATEPVGAGVTIGTAAIDIGLLSVLIPVIAARKNAGALQTYLLVQHTIGVVTAEFKTDPPITDLAFFTIYRGAIQRSAVSLKAAGIGFTISPLITARITGASITGLTVGTLDVFAGIPQTNLVLTQTAFAIGAPFTAQAFAAGGAIGPPTINIGLLTILDPVLALVELLPISVVLVATIRAGIRHRVQPDILDYDYIIADITGVDKKPD